MKNQSLHLSRKVSNYVGNPINESVHTYIDTHASMHTYSFYMRTPPPTRSRPKVKTKRPEFKKRHSFLPQNTPTAATMHAR